jgi:hypothetical protein
MRLISGRFAETGGDVRATIERKEHEFPPVPSLVTGEGEAKLISLACSAPAGRACAVVAVTAGEACRVDRRYPRYRPLHDQAGAKNKTSPSPEEVLGHLRCTERSL